MHVRVEPLELLSWAGRVIGRLSGMLSSQKKRDAARLCLARLWIVKVPLQSSHANHIQLVLALLDNV